MQLCLTKLCVILEIDPYVKSLDFFNERIIAATSNFQGMSAKNDSFLQIGEIVRIYANSKYLECEKARNNMCFTDRNDMTIAVKVALNPSTTNQQSKYLDRNVRWALFTLAEYMIEGLIVLKHFIFRQR